VTPKTSDWLKLAGVGVLALALAGIGIRVAGGIDGLVVPEPATTSQSPTAATLEAAPEVGASTTVFRSEQTDSSAAGTPSTTEAPVPRLEVDSVELDFGESADDRVVQLTNAGSGSLLWSIDGSGPELSFNETSGVLEPGDSFGLSTLFDRSVAEEGAYMGTFDVIWDDGTERVSIRAVVQENPVLHNPSAHTNPVKVAGESSCSPTTSRVSIRIRDTSELESVVMRWSNGSTSQETRMEASGEEMYEAVIGPFVAAGSHSAKIVAKDVHGNAGGATFAIEASACP